MRCPMRKNFLWWLFAVVVLALVLGGPGFIGGLVGGALALFLWLGEKAVSLTWQRVHGRPLVESPGDGHGQ